MGTPRRKAWPVGQVVKTAASHAVNIGSNPVRVTIFRTWQMNKGLLLYKTVAIQQLVLIRARVHPFPSRTRKLSSLLPTILGWRRPGKIGSANMERSHSIEWLLFLLFWRKGYSAGYPFWLDKIYWFIFRYDPVNWIQWGSWKYVTNRSDIQIKNFWVYSTGYSMKIPEMSIVNAKKI